MTTIADAELVQRCRRRDADAFGEIVERHQRLVFGVALARCGDPALAEDVAQEAFVTAWRDLDRLRDDARVGTWVAGIARNLAAGAARTRARRATPPPLDPGVVPTPEEIVLAHEDRELLARALADVPHAHREALVLFYLEGESVARIADQLAITEDLVKQRLSRGRRMLREGVVDRVESALARVRDKPAFRAGVIAALAAAGTRRAAAASTAGKVLAVMTIHKVAIGLGVLALAGGAAWLATRHGDTTRAAQPSARASAAQDQPPTHARRIDPATRTALLDAIHRVQLAETTAHAAASHTGAGTSSSSSSGPRPQLPDAPDLDKDYIRGQVKEIVPLLAECYEQELAHEPKLAGKVVVNFTIEGEPSVGGLVTESTIDADKSTMPSPAVRECIQETMYSLEVVAPQGGGTVKVAYPFEFRPADDDGSGTRE